MHDRTDGYRAHIAAEPGTGIITGEELTMAAGEDNSDAAVEARFLAREHAPGQAGPDQDGPEDGLDQAGPDQDGQGGTGGDGPLTWYGDTNYSSGDLLAAITAVGDAAVIKPRTPRPGKDPARFTTAGFTPTRTPAP
ncbi:MAG TPA: hypothetical protein VFQ44_24730 [Streptosporangiaceae bacterium]|nr:hypothetical protein [Streptosporangiaceae bacterium]